MSDWTALRAEVTGAARRVGDELRGFPDPHRPLQRVKWSAAEVGAHLVSLPRRYRRAIAAPQPFPASLSADNARELDAVPERDPAELADLLLAEVGKLLDELGDDPGRRVWYFEAEHTAEGLAGVMLTELLIHGHDLAGAQGHEWPITDEQATVCLRGVLPALPLAVDPQTAAAATGTYHIGLRGSDDWTIGVREKKVTVERGRPAKPDLHLSASPVTFLFSGYGLISTTRAALTGAVITWGRRPWLATRLARLFKES